MENEKLREHAEKIVSHMVGPEMTKLGRGSKKIVENSTRRIPIFQSEKKCGLKTLDFS